MITNRPERIAAIDIGTNAIHLLIARVIPQTGGFDVLDHDKDMVRLGAGLGHFGELTDQAMERAIAALKNFQGRVNGAGATLRVVATSAVREATNREGLRERVRKELGIAIEVA